MVKEKSQEQVPNIIVIKRDGRKVAFDPKKIVTAIKKAMPLGNGVKQDVAEQVAHDIENVAVSLGSISIAQIESLVFDKLVAAGQKQTARAYESYRSVREFQRNADNSLDTQVQEMLGGKSEYWNTENSNKNARLVTTQRDYMAGIVSTQLTRKYILPPDIVQAHDEGIIHFHDADYMAQGNTNCCLINLADMLQNGTTINNVHIDKPHRLITAATIATQAITACSSSQYGQHTAV